MTKIKGRHLQKRRTTQKSDGHAACFGKRLSEMRRREHLTQRELAKSLHVSAGTICNYEKGIHEPDFGQVCAIAAFFGVTTDYLLGLAPINISFESLQKDVCDGVQLSDLIQDVCGLDETRLKGLALLLDTTSISSRIDRKKQVREMA